MVETKEKPDTGSYKFEWGWCSNCRGRRTFWYVSKDVMKCADCETEKPKPLGFESGPLNTR